MHFNVLRIFIWFIFVVFFILYGSRKKVFEVFEMR